MLSQCNCKERCLGGYVIVQWHPTEVEVEVNLQPTVSRPVCPGVRRPSGTCNQFFFILEISFRQLQLCYFVAPSLMRGLVCNLLVAIASGPCQSSHSWLEVPQNSRPYFTVSFETPPTWRARSPYLYPPGTEWPSYTPGHWVTFLSPLTTRRDYGGGILTRLHTGTQLIFLRNHLHLEDLRVSQARNQHEIDNKQRNPSFERTGSPLTSSSVTSCMSRLMAWLWVGLCLLQSLTSSWRTLKKWCLMWPLRGLFAGSIKLQGLSPRANHTDWATATYRQSKCHLLRIEGGMWSV
jgi:hypothetical protein